jgi:transcriptional regulator with XRE-family HTH domain
MIYVYRYSQTANLVTSARFAVFLYLSTPLLLCLLLSIFDKTIFSYMNHLGNRIRELRELNNIKQREIAAFLKTDTAQISKIEKGIRLPKREQIIVLASILKADQEELISLWLADKVYDVVKDENMADQALETVSKNIKQNLNPQ